MAELLSMPGAAAVSIEAQAKINLRLRILAREDNGYHQLETLFLRINLADTVRVRRTDASRTLDMSGNTDPAAIGPTESNLAWRAAQAYLAASRSRHGFAIEIEKRIPIGGGLGGGSADAAAVLRALEAMAVEPLGPRKLLSLAASLGADVPFLTSEATYALAWGRGERLLAIAPPTARSILLVVPSFGINTAEAYGWLDANRKSDPPAIESALLDQGALGDWDDICTVMTNDFEAPATARHPELAAVLASLRSSEDVGCALMTGSGSTLYAVARGGRTVRDFAGTGTGLLDARTILTQTATRVERVTAIA